MYFKPVLTTKQNNGLNLLILKKLKFGIYFPIKAEEKNWTHKSHEIYGIVDFKK
jgi:hypothetical protein